MPGGRNRDSTLTSSWSRISVRRIVRRSPGKTMEDQIDWIDWDTGEVTRVDGLQYVITTHCSKQPGYLLQAPTLVEAIFRAFLANANQPLSARKLAPMVGHQPDQVLRLLSSRTVRLGLRPVLKVG